jgi:hypothetical protein
MFIVLLITAPVYTAAGLGIEALGIPVYCLWRTAEQKYFTGLTAPDSLPQIFRLDFFCPDYIAPVVGQVHFQNTVFRGSLT